MQTRTIIAAVAKNKAIGFKNKLPWNLDDDWKHFKAVTAGHSFLMGRRSYEAEDHLLSDKWNYVLTQRSNIPLWDKSSIVSSFQEFLQLTKREAEIFILGGATVFDLAIRNNWANKMILTHVDASPQADAYFPDVDWSEWKEIDHQEFKKNEVNDFDFKIVTYLSRSIL
ncbi:dihydrofolate reductase [Membranihabitans marinus]|uniref:dihydrofolate reductase n=1 Tax=Membranihabitans marinus TaxID=1227546 RepID=UPI001F230865|nr:dihydrofolate reductase [Membranihabitans marinus]